MTVNREVNVNHKYISVARKTLIFEYFSVKLFFFKSVCVIRFCTKIGPNVSVFILAYFPVTTNKLSVGGIPHTILKNLA